MDKLTEEIYKCLDLGVWQDVHRETPYFENQVAPHPPYPEEKGLEVGEFDILLVNYDRELAYYVEVKTNPNDELYGREQVRRAEQFFEDTDWDLYGRVVVEVTP